MNLSEIVQEMYDWLLNHGITRSIWLTCPNPNCGSHENGYQTFSINVGTAKYHCVHCNLSGYCTPVTLRIPDASEAEPTENRF